MSICCEVKIPPRSCKCIENSNKLGFYASVSSLDENCSSCIKSNTSIKAMELFFLLLFTEIVFLLNLFVNHIMHSFMFIPKNNNLYPEQSYINLYTFFLTNSLCDGAIYGDVHKLNNNYSNLISEENKPAEKYQKFIALERLFFRTLIFSQFKLT